MVVIDCVKEQVQFICMYFTVFVHEYSYSYPSFITSECDETCIFGICEMSSFSGVVVEMVL